MTAKFVGKKLQRFSLNLLNIFLTIKNIRYEG